jgi:hypothetical protein
VETVGKNKKGCFPVNKLCRKGKLKKKFGREFCVFIKTKKSKTFETLNSIKNEKIFRLLGNFDNGGNTYIRFLSCI